MNQTIFDFPSVNEFYEEDFIVSTSNIKAYNALANFELWNEKRLIIRGEEGSGKSHLSKIFSIKTNALVLENNFDINNLPKQNLIFENIEQYKNETNFFHLINFAKNNSLYLLLTTDANLDIMLPDLKSRLESSSQAKIKSPDEILFRTIIHKNFHDRQINLESDVLDFITKRLKRSYKAIKEFVMKVDNYSLSNKRPITIPLIKKVIEIDDRD